MIDCPRYISIPSGWFDGEILEVVLQAARRSISRLGQLSVNVFALSQDFKGVDCFSGRIKACSSTKVA